MQRLHKERLQSCTLKGVCGKTSEVANLQDLLLFVVRGIAVYNEHLRKDGHPSEQADKFIYDALFITITNANFDKVAITEKIKEGLKLKNELANKVKIDPAVRILPVSQAADESASAVHPAALRHLLPLYH